MHKPFFILFLLTLFFLACKKKEKIVEVEKEVIVYQEPAYKWKRVSYFDKVQSTNIKNTVNIGDNRLLFYSSYGINLYDSVTNTFTNTLFPFTNDIQVNPVINEMYCSSVIQGLVLLIPTAKDIRVSGSNQTRIEMRQFDSTFYNYNFDAQLRTGEMIGNQNSLIIPYVTTNNTTKYLCLKLKKYTRTDANAGTSLVVESSKKITARLPSLPYEGVGNITFSTVGNNFLVRLNNSRNYILTPAFDTIPINKDWTFMSSFTYKGTYYAVVSTATGYKMATTNDEGLTWSTPYILDEGFRYLNYSQVGDKLIAYTANSATAPNVMYQLFITPEGIDSRELVNDGLSNITVKSLNLCNGHVFVSTTNGVFERPYSEFIEYKN